MRSLSLNNIYINIYIEPNPKFIQAETRIICAHNRTHSHTESAHLPRHEHAWSLISNNSVSPTNSSSNEYQIDWTNLKNPFFRSLSVFPLQLPLLLKLDTHTFHPLTWDGSGFNDIYCHSVYRFTTRYLRTISLVHGTRHVDWNWRSKAAALPFNNMRSSWHNQ